jgi:DNA-binding NarL/FixJ family response regulator
MIRVHITDDHRMLVEGLSAAINASDEVRVTGVSHSAADARRELALSTVDVLLLDISLPDGNGIDLCAELRSKYPDMRILILTSHGEYSKVRAALANGASGYILKNALSEEVVDGIIAVAEGETFICEEIDAMIHNNDDADIRLTARERELLRLIADGYNNQEMADKMFLSVETVKTYRKNLILKLGAKNSMVLVKMAIEDGMI